MNKKFNIILTALILFVICMSDLADAERRVRVQGRKDATITTKFIRLGDIAHVTGETIQDDDIVIGLKKINLGKSPAPGKFTALTASSILQTMKDEGVLLEDVGYTLPRVIKVTRASRTLTKEELLAVINRYVSDTERDLDIRSIKYDRSIQVAPGRVELKVIGTEADGSDSMKFTMNAEVEDESPLRFLVKADIDEWREIPVAKRPITRGVVIAKDDVAMARLNANAIPKDAAVEVKDILGLETDQSIGYGEVFRRNKLAIHPVVKKGSKVTIEYKRGPLHATAVGIALDAGIEGDEIKVRNRVSEKVIFGTVVATGLVRVSK